MHKFAEVRDPQQMRSRWLLMRDVWREYPPGTTLVNMHDTDMDKCRDNVACTAHCTSAVRGETNVVQQFEMQPSFMGAN